MKQSFEFELLWTKLFIEVFCKEDMSATISQLLKYCQEFESTYSRFIPGNYLDTLNKNFGWKLLPELSEMLKFGLRLSEYTDGAFDMSIKQALDYIGYDKDYRWTTADIKDFHVNYKNIEISEDQLMLHNGISIEVGSLGKGYLLQYLAEKLSPVCEDVLLNFGWDIYTKWLKRIWIENPFNDKEIIGYIDAHECFLAWSNWLKRKFQHYHHLVSLHTKDWTSDIAWVYVQWFNGMATDWRSTALFVSGFDKAVELIGKHDILALLVRNDGSFFKHPDYEWLLYSE